MDEELIGSLVDAVDWAHLDAGLVLHVEARLGDDIRHRTLLLVSVQLPSADCARRGTSVRHRQAARPDSIDRPVDSGDKAKCPLVIIP